MTILNTKTLKMFVAVADTLNFRQAAEQMRISQPPLSRAIREMEERLGVVLFYRNTHSASITTAGSELLPKAKAILGLLDAAERGLRQHLAPTALRLGLTSSVEPGLFETIIQKLSQLFCDTTLIISYATSPTLITQLRANRLDAALIAMPTMTYGLEVESSRYTQLSRLPRVAPSMSGLQS